MLPVSDIHLLACEAELFTGGHPQAQIRAAAADATTAGTGLTSAAANFTAAGVTAGMVCVLGAAADDPVEIVTVTNATTLVVSPLRYDSGEAARSLRAAQCGAAQPYQIVTFAPALQASARALARWYGLGPYDPRATILFADLLDPDPFCAVAALRTLWALYRVWIAGKNDTAGAEKCTAYREAYLAARAETRLYVSTQDAPVRGTPSGTEPLRG